MLNLKQNIKRLLRSDGSIDPLAGLDAKEREIIANIRSKKLTYLSDKKIAAIANTCKAIEKNQLPGIFVEAGCALGGSTILIANLKSLSRPFNVYDVFGMIPPPTDADTPDVHERYKIIAEGKSSGIGGDKYYGYEENLYEVVISNLKSFGIDCKNHTVRLIKGLVQDTMTIDCPVAFAHVDVDWYDPVMTCLERIVPHLTIGGSLILDDYFDWGGCKKATDEFLSKTTSQFEIDGFAGSLKLTKTKD